MGTQPTGGGSTSSFSNAPQGNPDSYIFTEEGLLSDSSVYHQASRTIFLDVMSNDLGGNAKSLFSIDDGGTGAMTELLQSNVTTGWEQTADGNYIRINAGKIEYRINDGSNDPNSALDVNVLGADDVIQDSFVYAIRMANGTLAMATVTVTITGTNDGPVANADTATGGENELLTIDVLANDTDVDAGAVLTVTAASAPAGQGSASVVSNQVQFDPGTDFDHLAVGETAAVIVDYTIEDEHGASSSSTVEIIVTGTNDGPVAVADTAAGGENETLTIDVIANDTDVDDGATLTVTAASAPAGQGSASIVANQVQFDPGSDFDHLAVGDTATVIVDYTIEDEHGASSSSIIEITVTGTNDGPVAVADTAAGGENETLTIDVVANDTDADDGAILTVTAASTPAGQGSASVVGNQVQFDPGTDFDYLADGDTATVTVSYTIEDEHGASSSSTVEIIVTGTNDGPVANADTAAGGENEVLAIDVLANDTDVDDGAVLTVTTASAPAGQGSASVVGNQVQFDPGSDFDHLAAGDTATVIVSYSIEDEHGASSSSTVEITVTGTNDGPVAVADTAAGGENETLTIDVLANDTDVDDGAVLTVTTASAPAGQGSASIVANQVQFDPGSDFDHLAAGDTATVIVSYSIEDEHGASSSSTVEITVTGTNDGPVAVADTATGGENETLTIDVLSNDTDVDDGATLTVTAASAPAGQGSASIVGNQVQFDPGTDFDHLAAGDTATVIVDYTIEDEHGASSSSTVEITVTGTNDGPVAVADTATGGENETLTIDVLSNDTDVDDGASLTVTAASAPAGQGSASVVGNQVQFDPGTDFDYLADGDTATVVVDYTIEDEHGASSSSTVEITVTGTNDGPVAVADTAAGGENETLTIDVLSNDTDVDDGATLTVIAASAPAGQGSASVVANQVQFDPGTDFDYLADGDTATVIVDYTIEDEHGASSSSTVEITVTGTNDAPVASNGSGATDEDIQLVGTLPTGSDAESDPITYALDADASNGTVTVDPDGSFTYTPDADFNGTDSFTFTVSDGNGGSNTYSYEITVNAVNDAPEGSGDSYATDEDIALVIAAPGVLGNDGDVEGDALTAVLVSGPSNGTLGLNADGSFTYTPDPDYSGPDSFTYTPNDGTTDGNTVTVNITVNPINDAPAITSDGGAATASISVEENQTAVTTVTSTDVDGPSPTYSIVGGDDGDKFVINPTTGVLSFIAPPDYESPTDSDSDNGYEVVVEVSDGTATDTQAITVTVTDVAEGAPPAATNDAWTLSDETAIAPGVITAAWFTHNDSDPDGDTLYVTDVSGLPSGLTANFDGSGHLIDITGTTPAAGSYNISYTLSDGSNSTTATVAITVVNTTSSGTDTIVLNGNDFSYVDLLSGADTVTGDLVLTGNAGIDTFVGGAGSDTLNGGAGNDALTGDAGDDKLNGGIGNDVLTGGNNADQFIFNSALNAATNVDTIMDFNAADGAASNQDSIVLEDAIFAGFGPTLDAGEFAANAGGNATGASAQILYDTATGNLYYDSDGTGGANKILFATISLAGVSDTVDHSDFLIV